MLTNNVKIEQMDSIDDHIDELSELLIQVVEDGASIGFLSPLQTVDAEIYWSNLLNSDLLLFVAKMNNKIVGSVQLQLCRKQNGKHRAEIGKLMTHPDYRRKGIGRSLMNKAEEQAKHENRSLLVLDTREGDPSNLLYSSIGFNQVGIIPNYAKSGDGKLHSTVYYYKIIPDD
ncbi:GNAT family N-acetyltransferase [Halalkalibacter okhensis]|uniref:GCN5 family acetyltransferase n=1 Tax=Halalkalibacter okhensis TaxID=333138 RepID=A0A0B0IDJ2_9BACI|nr:GNAT family N-acetyltransferase [Halalkalibacter okhensis]KHF38912.1 GCN5 family acetyltransferase [Halalkalibacter okhensis]